MGHKLNFKRAYEVFLDRGSPGPPLAAAYRNQLQWTEPGGGDIVLSLLFGRRSLQASGHEPVSRIDEPVDRAVVDALLTIPIRGGYEVHGMTHAEFDDFGATLPPCASSSSASSASRNWRRVVRVAPKSSNSACVIPSTS